MSTLIELLRSRRSIRLFLEEAITDEQTSILEESLLRSPTSRGRNPWQFIRVDDPQLIKQVAQAKSHGSAFLAGAAQLYVICADESISDVWIEDCAIAAITLHYTAHSLGLGSCWVQIRLRQHASGEASEAWLKKLLNLPEQLRVASIIGIGKPDEVKPGHPEADLPVNRFHENGY